MQLAQMEEYRARNHYHQTVLRSLEVIVSINHHIAFSGHIVKFRVAQ